MQDKTLNLKDSVYSLCARYPALREELAALGFPDIVKPGMLQSAGRFMTLEKGAKLRRLDLDTLIRRLEDAGYTVLR